MLIPDEFFVSQIDWVLGADFLEENKVVIKFEAKKIEFGKGLKTTPLGITDASLPPFRTDEVFILSC